MYYIELLIGAGVYEECNPFFYFDSEAEMIKMIPFFLNQGYEIKIGKEESEEDA